MPRFRLLAGKHVETAIGPDGKPLLDQHNHPLQIKYVPGDVFDTQVDLAAEFNSRGSVKFELAYDQTPLKGGQIIRKVPPIDRGGDGATQAPAAAKPESPFSTKAPDFDPAFLEAMTFNELKAFAAEEEIDLKGATSKDAALKSIRAALAVLLPAGK